MQLLGAWWARRDSNSHVLRHRLLKPARLPFRHSPGSNPTEKSAHRELGNARTELHGQPACGTATWGREDLPRPGPDELVHAVRPEPLLRHQEQRPAIL